jgi:hypothetical protein
MSPELIKPIMESVLIGWQSEVNSLDWSEEKKLDHMTKYSDLYITDRADFPFSKDDREKIKKPDLKKLDLKVRK